MAIRMTGMISGMDTESLIQSMVDAQRLKNKRVSDKSQILEWKQERLKEINSKLYKLYAEDLTKLRLQSGYGTKKVTSSNESLVEIKAGSVAPLGTGTITGIITATSQSVISANLDSKATSASTLKELGLTSGVASTIIVTSGSKEVSFVINEDTTITEFVDKLKNAGLNANFDNVQKRLFISSKLSGEENQFTIKEYGAGAKNYIDNIKTAIDYNNFDSVKKQEVNALLDNLKNIVPFDPDNADLIKLVNLAQSYSTKQVEAAADIVASKDAYDVANTTILAGFTVSDEVYSSSEYKEKIETYLKAKGVKDEDLNTEGKKILQKYKAVEDAVRTKIRSSDTWTGTEEELEQEVKSQLDKYSIDILSSEYDKVVKSSEVYRREYTTSFNNYESEHLKLDEIKDNLINNVQGFISNANVSSSSLSVLGLGEVTNQDMKDAKGMLVRAGKDASVNFNGVAISSSSNTINVNGITITLKGETSNNEKITFGVVNDTQSTYDTIKKFVTNYNAIIKEMNELYYADSAKDYAPLSEDEKAEMSESQIEKWEKKIKDSMLRRDSTVGNLLTAMKQSIMQPVKGSDGKTYSLASFGIGTSSDYTEKGLLHIDGNADDAAFANYADKLMKALEEDPDLVADVMAKTVKNLYDAIDSKIKAIPNVRSAFTFYNDKLFIDQQRDYKKKITQLEAKLIAIENKYYKQFAAMEKAMATLQSQSNALAGMLGTNSGN